MAGAFAPCLRPMAGSLVTGSGGWPQPILPEGGRLRQPSSRPFLLFANVVLSTKVRDVVYHVSFWQPWYWLPRFKG